MVHKTPAHADPKSMAIRKGTLLGPMLWLLYVDILKPSTTDRVHDVNRELQTAIDDTTVWCDENNMMAKSKKSLVLSISNQHNNHVPVHQCSQ